MSGDEQVPSRSTTARITPGQILAYASATVAVLQTLHRIDAKLTYGQLGEVIGLVDPSQGWKPWHRQQLDRIMKAANATDPTTIEPLWDRIVSAATGEPGAGRHRPAQGYVR